MLRQPRWLAKHCHNISSRLCGNLAFHLELFAPAYQAKSSFPPDGSSKIRPPHLLAAKPGADEVQFVVTRDEHAIRLFSVSINDDPVDFVGTGCFGQTDDGVTRVDGLTDVRKRHLCAATHANAARTEGTNKRGGLYTRFIIRAAEFEKTGEGTSWMEGVQDHRSRHIATGIGFDLFVTGSIESADVGIVRVRKRFWHDAPACQTRELVERSFGKRLNFLWDHHGIILYAGRMIKARLPSERRLLDVKNEFEYHSEPFFLRRASGGTTNVASR